MILQIFRTWTFGYHFPIGSFWKIFLVGGLKVVLCWIGFCATLRPKIYKCMCHRKVFMMSTHRNIHKNAFYFFFFSVRKIKKRKYIWSTSFFIREKKFKNTQMLQSEQEEHILLKTWIILISPMTAPFLLTCCNLWS